MPSYLIPLRPVSAPHDFLAAAFAVTKHWPFQSYKVTVTFVSVHAMKASSERGFIAPFFLNPGTKWMSVVSATSRPVYHVEKNPGTH